MTDTIKAASTSVDRTKRADAGTADAPMEAMMADSTAPAVKAMGSVAPDLQPATTKSPAPNPLLSNEVPAEQLPPAPRVAEDASAKE